MANERLRLAIVRAGLTPAELAERVGVDPKTVERWITKGRVPRPRQRAATTTILGSQELFLWPESVDSPQARTARQAELVRLYAHRGEVPADYWYELIRGAKSNIDILVFSGLFLPDGHADLGKMLIGKADDGVQIRYLVGDPEGHAVLRRGDEEEIGDYLAARCALTIGYLRGLLAASSVRVRMHDTTLYNSIYRFDDDVFVNAHAYGAPASDSPVLHLRRVAGGRLFDHYVASFNRVWALSGAVRVPPVRRRGGS